MAKNIEIALRFAGDFKGFFDVNLWVNEIEYFRIVRFVREGKIIYAIESVESEEGIGRQIEVHFKSWDKRFQIALTVKIIEYIQEIVSLKMPNTVGHILQINSNFKLAFKNIDV